MINSLTNIFITEKYEFITEKYELLGDKYTCQREKKYLSPTYSSQKNKNKIKIKKVFV